MNKKRKEGFMIAAILLILHLVFFGCGNDPGGEYILPPVLPPPNPEGINGFPETLTMGVPFDLRKGITINLPDAPDKTFDDIIWANNTSGTAFATTQIVIEDDQFIPVTFFRNSVTVYAIVRDGEGEGFDYTKTFQTNIVFPLNPFIGSWSGSDGKTWTFRKNGTYSIDSTTNDGSFAVWSGKPGRKFLVTVSGDPSTITVEKVVEDGLYTPYCFEQTGDTITITPIEFDYHAVSNKQDPNSFEKIGEPVTLTRQSGAPAALELLENTSASMMVGTWSAAFYAAQFNPNDSANAIPNGTITYYPDGRVAQNYEGAWLKRGAVFITVGNDGRRWDPPALASWDKKTAAAGTAEIVGKDVILINEYRTAPGEPYSRQTNTSLYWRLVKIGTDPGIPPADTYIPLVNPFIGVWKAGGEYWQFKYDGTGGKAATEAGSSLDTFSFFVFLESQFYTSGSPKQSLVTLDNDGNVTRYGFSIAQNKATLTPSDESDSIILERVSGAPAALNLKNPLIGEYNATWSSTGEWSIQYRADGTARFYHRSMGHQFENSYTLRGNTLVICGNMRFAANPIKATIENQADGTWKATEASGTTYYIYTKVDAAVWKE